MSKFNRFDYFIIDQMPMWFLPWWNWEDPFLRLTRCFWVGHLVIPHEKPFDNPVGFYCGRCWKDGIEG